MVSYEELTEDTFSVINNLIKELGLQPKPDKINQAIENWSIGNFRKKNGDNQKNTNCKMVRSAKTGEWQRYMNEEHKKLFKQLAAEILIKYGYEKDLEW